MATEQQRRIRVLVIDDSSTIRIAATKVFGEDFDIFLAVDGEDGLDVIENDQNIQVIFTDLVMPEMDGFELLKRIRQHPTKRISQLPVIVMTGAENTEIAKQKALEFGATDFITKPFDATDIRTRALSYSKLAGATEKLRQTATLDELTGLFNPRGFVQHLEKGITFATRHQHHSTVMCVGIDNYKELFVSMGRVGTERLVKRIAAVLANTCRKEDSIGRMDMTRFCSYMPAIDQENALEIANKVCRQVESIKATLKGKRVALTVSAGIAHHSPERPIKAKSMLRLAHHALEHAKSLGRSQIYLFNSGELLKHKQNGANLSIDSLIKHIQSGEDHLVADKLNDALEQLAPLIALMSHEQKQQLISQRL